MNDRKVLIRRFIAYLVDWYVGALVIGFPITLFSQKLFGKPTVLNLLKFPEPYGVIAGILSLVCGLFYFVVVPTWNWKGQTLGKHLLHLKIVTCNDVDINLKTIVIREVLVIMLFEEGMYNISTIIQQLFTLLTHIEVVRMVVTIFWVITIVSALLVVFDKNAQSLHDRIAHTKVVRI